MHLIDVIKDEEETVSNLLYLLVLASVDSLNACQLAGHSWNLDRDIHGSDYMDSIKLVTCSVTICVHVIAMYYLCTLLLILY